MGHTNSTTYYNLPQFLTSDKPAWLTDINNAMSDIDTGLHSAQSDATTAGNNATQALTDAGNAATAAATADAKGAGACASIEAAFDSTTVYAVGAKVMYNSLLYRCTVAVDTPGPWTGSANWERITVDSLIASTAGDLPLGSNFSDSSSTAYAIKNLQDSREWTFIDQKQGSVAITLPDTWNELYVICRYGTSGGAQPQLTTGVVIPILAGRSLIIGGGSLFAQVDLNALATQIQMNYFEINGANHTSTSYFSVYYR